MNILYFPSIWKLLNLLFLIVIDGLSVKNPKLNITNFIYQDVLWIFKGGRYETFEVSWSTDIRFFDSVIEYG